MSAINRSQYPADGIPEIALVGRSNVGKSSTVNTLLNRRNFARTSQTPGKTRTINFYLINKEFFFVDLPGYGYAKIAKSEKDKWGVIMERYLQDRPELCAIFLLVDIRHEPTNDDVMMYEWIKHFGYNCVVIATKADKISRGQYQKHFNIIRKKLQLEKDEKIALANSKKGYLQPCDIWHLENKVKDVLSIGNQTGEGWFLTAEMIEYMEHDIPNIICVQPFACLPNHVVGKGVIKTIREKYPEANISPVDYDPGSSETNQANRIKLLMTVAKDNLQRQENEKKALDNENKNVKENIETSENF